MPRMHGLLLLGEVMGELAVTGWVRPLLDGTLPTW